MTTFAGFDYPKPLWTLNTVPRDPAKRARRLEELRRDWSRRQASGRTIPNGYYQSEPRVVAAAKDCTLSAYHEGDGPALGLRWSWCDEIEGARIDHHGWYTDDEGAGDTMRGFVARLPHGRGFIIGWSMGKGMCCALDYSHVWERERDATYAADSFAERAAESERDYQREERERIEREEREADERAAAELRELERAYAISMGAAP